MAVKTNQRTWRAGLAGPALALLLAGPAVAQELRIGINGDADMLDPTLSRTLTGRVVFAALCDKLVDIDADLNYVPQLATSWKWSEDGKSLTMTLRQGVKFHDGEPFDAAAVVYNLDRHLKLPGSNRRNELGTFSGAEAIDGHTVRLNLSAPFAPLVAVLSDRAGMMVSPKAARELGDKFGNAPVCAGAFKFVRRVAQDRIVLEKFAGYWNAANIHFDGVTYLPIADAAVRVANVRAGSIDIAEAILPSDVAELQRDARIRLATGPSLAVYRIEFNIANGEQAKTPLGQSAKVRQAFELAIDRNVLNQVAFDGQYIPGNQSVPTGGKFYIASLPFPPRDVARARALLKEAGLDRLKFKLL
ncbi:MAG: ABC transporter substrate-binding protein, partial [Proteobacteria bacterium]|nr:ABC transporter substrate-binding protein [Pseudomonadota bacterium]